MIVYRTISKGKIKWFRCELLVWGKQHRRKFPWRNTSYAYAILAAEFMLQKTNAPLVAPLYEEFMEKYPTVEALAETQFLEIKNILQPLGLSFRAERLHKSAQLLVKEYQGKIPNTQAELLKLPGVGKYTARSICANAYGQNKAVIDTNVARIFERFFGFEGGRVKSRCPLLWQAAEEIAPPRDVGIWNLTLFDFGAEVCTAKNPHCDRCLLRERCGYLKQQVK
ncbi:A/G-specific adenine glycosylase [Plectonema cf. radiosum LEGE 06105]|uniref:Adenine DNA glycosylase n=1 Tax=Plectonema cf. radiosum LEGE 06105 TaxID=945769 RepID=A0A8J7F3F7_9CYAN|nr:A/G-specific adenine glycosylase [Plectonema radiosum]MBE9212510.1 A/G-specific adenine glycosylase [Plectonema cf. radiosum LEGE 06105]